MAQLTNVDLDANATWTTKVRDNYGALKASYDPALADGALTENGVSCPSTPCRMDFNEDRQLWVSAKAIVRGKPRSIVARLKLEQLRESVPQAGVVAGALDVTNTGNKLMVDGSGSSIIVRCSPLASPSCMSYDSEQGTAHADPGLDTEPAQLHDPGPARAVQGAREGRRHLLRRRHLPGERRAADGRGGVGGTLQCGLLDIGPYSSPCVVPGDLSTNCINPTTKAGLLIWHCGTLSMQSQMTFYGIVYIVNNSDNKCSGYTAKSGGCPSGWVYETNGGAGVLGALVVDGGGCVLIGSNSLNVKYDANVFNSVTSYGTVGLVQNTWRELKAGS